MGLPSSARTELEEGDGGPPGDGSKQHTPQATSTEGSPLKSSASDAPKAGLESGQSSSQEDLVQSSATQVVQDSQSEVWKFSYLVLCMYNGVVQCDHDQAFRLIELVQAPLK